MNTRGDLPELMPGELYAWRPQNAARLHRLKDGQIVCSTPLALNRWRRRIDAEGVPYNLEICPKCWPLVTSS